MELMQQLVMERLEYLVSDKDHDKCQPRIDEGHDKFWPRKDGGCNKCHPVHLDQVQRNGQRASWHPSINRPRASMWKSTRRSKGLNLTCECEDAGRRHMTRFQNAGGGKAPAGFGAAVIQ